ncbi:MAG: hypothetical protein ACRYGB_03850 [Janthinobacterium lividum]
MKKLSLFLPLAVVLSCSISSCATVFGGKITSAQRTKPAPGQPSRKIRAVAMIADIVLFPVGLIVDFATDAIYKPEKSVITTPSK